MEKTGSALLYESRMLPSEEVFLKSRAIFSCYALPRLFLSTSLKLKFLAGDFCLFSSLTDTLVVYFCGL